MTPERIVEIRAMLKAATPEPWEIHDTGIYGGSEHYYIAGFEYGCGIEAHDAALIQSAPTVIAELIEEVERLQRPPTIDHPTPLVMRLATGRYEYDPATNTLTKIEP